VHITLTSLQLQVMSFGLQNLVIFFFSVSVQCPGELLKTERGKFLWEPVAHGEISKLLCPYGMSTTYTEHLEQMALDSARELGYFPFHNPTSPTKPDVKIHDLDRRLFHLEMISDAEQRVSCEKNLRITLSNVSHYMTLYIFKHPYCFVQYPSFCAPQNICFLCRAQRCKNLCALQRKEISHHWSHDLLPGLLCFKEPKTMTSV